MPSRGGGGREARGERERVDPIAGKPCDPIPINEMQACNVQSCEARPYFGKLPRAVTIDEGGISWFEFKFKPLSVVFFCGEINR